LACSSTMKISPSREMEEGCMDGWIWVSCAVMVDWANETIIGCPIRHEHYHYMPATWCKASALPCPARSAQIEEFEPRGTDALNFLIVASRIPTGKAVELPIESPACFVTGSTFPGRIPRDQGMRRIRRTCWVFVEKRRRRSGRHRLGVVGGYKRMSKYR
jgi:hypothetical protein